MATRLSFAQFDAKLKSGTLTAAEHRRYIEVDPAADQIRVRFKPGALRDEPPAAYDVDKEIYLAQRAAESRALLIEPALVLPAIPRPRVTAEGDSWFNLPPVIRPPAIADQLKSNKRIVVQNIAKWGHTLAQMLQAKEYLGAIASFKPEWFLFSGGGNDLQEALADGDLLHTYSPSRPIDQCIKETGELLLIRIAENYRSLLNEIAIKFPALRTICFAYDYPRPTFKKGRYIGRHLKRWGYPRNTWDEVAKLMINRLSDCIGGVVASFPNASFLDCRGITAPHAFYDDMHPGKAGFGALVVKYEIAMGIVSPVSLKAAPVRIASRKKKAAHKASKARGSRRAKRSRA